MSIKAVHRVSAVFIGTFVAIHLLNHLWGIFGAEDHIHVMEGLRVYYRNPVIEAILLTSVGIQMISGIKLCIPSRTKANTGFERLQRWTGLYLLFFLAIHVTAVFGARLFFHVDTNLYFGVAGINSFPANLFFIPYYGMAVISLFGHLAAMHARRMRHTVYGIRPARQAGIIMVIGMVITLAMFYGFTDGFEGLELPEPYRIPFK